VRIPISVLFLALTTAASPATGAWSLTVSPVTATTPRAAGGELVVGEGFSVTLDPGVGIWSSDRTSLLLTSGDAGLAGDLDPAALPLGPTPVTAPTALRGQGWEALLQAGTLVRDGQRLEFRAAAGAASGPATSWVPLLVIGALILLLLRRSAGLRRRLDEPRVSLRRRPHSD